jgi:hypothetical protein
MDFGIGFPSYIRAWEGVKSEDYGFTVAPAAFLIVLWC